MMRIQSMATSRFLLNTKGVTLCCRYEGSCFMPLMAVRHDGADYF
jgi:hypothetical protein